MKIEKQTDIRGGFSLVLGAPAPGRPNGFHSGSFSAEKTIKKMNFFIFI